jgi:hypothetical protein
MNGYNQKYNKDDVFIRSMIVSLLAEMNKKIYYYNREDDGSVIKITVPCLYSITGSERFLRDEFYYDALEEGKAIGDYERVPRCVVSLSGINVNASEQTNKYNHTKIVRESNGVLRTCLLNVEWIPVTLNFSCKIICSNNIELFKITECVISKIYKNPNYFKVDFGMFNVDGCLSVPTDYSHSIPTEFGFSDKKEFSMEFNVEMKSFIPAFEHGLLMCEIDEMLDRLPVGEHGLVQYRPNEKGEMEMRVGGIFEIFRFSAYMQRIDEPTILSNTHDAPMFARNDEELKIKDIKDNLVFRKEINFDEE